MVINVLKYLSPILHGTTLTTIPSISMKPTMEQENGDTSPMARLPGIHDTKIFESI